MNSLLRRTLLSRWWLLCFFLGSLVVQQPVWAQANKTVTIRENWPFANYGYRRIKVRVAELARKPATRSENFKLVVTQRNFQDGDTVAVKDFTLEAGQISVETEIYVPIKVDWSYNWVIHIEKDGNLRYDRRTDLFGTDVQNPYAYGGIGHTMLIVSSAITTQDGATTDIVKGKKRFKGKQVASGDLTKLPSISEIGDIFAVDQNIAMAKGAGGYTTAGLLKDSPSVHAIQPSDLPENWIGLSSVSIVLISAKDLQTVVTNQPDSAEALKKWVAAGGSLVVNDCGSNFEKAEQVRRQIVGKSQQAYNGSNPWWRITNSLSHQPRLISGSSYEYYYSSPLLENASVEPSIKKRRLAPHHFQQLPAGIELTDLTSLNLTKGNGLTGSAGFAFTKSLQGRLFVVKDNMQRWTSQDWIRLVNAISLSGRGIHERFAGSLSEPKSDFHIPGVGAPPIRAFQVLLCLFVILVGPVAFIFLSRRKKLQLMFVVVPVISLFACVCLMIYALFSEGLQVRGRVQSFTDVDHVTNMAVSHVRHSYYAGVQPSPYEFSSSDYVLGSNETQRATYFRQSGDQMSLTGGDIRPRMPHQVTAVHNYQLAEGLELLNGDDDQDPQIRNRFESKVEYAIIRTPGGWYEVSDVEPEETATATSVVFPVGAGNLKKTADQLSPSLSDPFEFRRNNYAYYSAYGRTQNNNVVPDCDFMIDELRSKTDRLYEVNTYIALVKELEQIKSPLPRIEYKHRLHVVRGRW